MKMPVDILTFFAQHIEKELGIIYNADNYYQLENRLDDVRRFFDIKTHEELLQRVQTDKSTHFRQYLLDVATNNETSFFRDARVFKNIQNIILPKLIEQSHQKGTELKIWSVACSTGQEPYTLTMALKEMIKPHQNIKVKIIASDISERVLTKARSGRYSQLEVQRGLPAPLMIKYFEKTEDDHWVVKKELRDMIRFTQFNLLSPSYPIEKFDLILCRNVLIYQKIASREIILDKLSHCLQPQGQLILGSGESLLGLKSTLEQNIIEGIPVYSPTKLVEKKVA